jgi:hypothetical protein
VEPILPYISDASTQEPEASIVSHLTSIIAILIFAFSYSRYRNIRKVFVNDISIDANRIKLLNLWSLLCGVIVGIGLTIVANFRITDTRLVHSIGFVLMIALIVIDINIQYKIAFINGNTTIGKKRALISIAIVICFILLNVLGHISMRLFGENNFLEFSKRSKWQLHQNGYVCHALSAFFQWIIVILIALYNSTFICEFKSFDEWALKPKKSEFV